MKKTTPASAGVVFALERSLIALSSPQQSTSANVQSMFQKWQPDGNSHTSAAKAAHILDFMRHE
jgi:hypothetical protein